VFQAAVPLTGAERTVFLNGACLGDALDENDVCGSTLSRASATGMLVWRTR
jgi:hypothetical protein